MEKRKFYQGKYEYYRIMNMWVVISVSILSIGYFLSDCYLLGGFSTVTLIPRTAIIVPLLLFLWLNAHTKDYHIMIPMSYIVGHVVMWGTIWSCVYLDDLSYACVGFFIIHFIFMALGIAAPAVGGIVGQGLLFVDIMIANTFLHYPDYNMMFLLGLPLYGGICIFDIGIEKVYRDQLAMKLKLEDNLKHDMLTGAYNRKAFAFLADKNNHLICSQGEYIGIAMYDLDHFKQINDTYGHAVGDEVLVKVTETVKSMLHEGEYLIRWGGEEFIIIMKNHEKEFESHAQELRKAVENLQFPMGRITISMGVTEYDGGDYQKIIEQADAAMYHAKNNGRNKVVMHHKI